MNDKRYDNKGVKCFARESIEKDGWIRCGKCGRKLFQVTITGYNGQIAMRCHSCKADNLWDMPFAAMR